MSYYEDDKFAMCILMGMLAGPSGPKLISSPQAQAEALKTAWFMASEFRREHVKRRKAFEEAEEDRHNRD